MLSNSVREPAFRLPDIQRPTEQTLDTVYYISGYAGELAPNGVNVAKWACDGGDISNVGASVASGPSTGRGPRCDGGTIGAGR